MKSEARKGVHAAGGGSAHGWQCGKMMGPFWAAVLLAAGPVLASGGDFSINFAAADPTTYNHSTGGGSWSDGFVTSLEGGDFRAGDIVSWLALVTVRSGADGPQTIQLDFSFAAVNTGHPGAGLRNLVSMEFTGDGYSEDEVTLLDYWSDEPLSPGDETLHCSVKIGDLYGGQKVVVRINTRLSRDPGSSPTGNLWGRLDAGTVAGFSGKDATISTGKQTVPFQRVGDIQAADITVVKLVSLANQTVGDAVHSLPVGHGTQVKYWLTVTNPLAGPLYNVVMMDDNGTEDPSDDFSVSLDGLAADGSLAGGASATGVILVTVQNTGTGSIIITNTATATGTNPASGALTDSDSATVTVGHLNHPPVAVDDQYSTMQGNARVVSAPGVLANDSDLDTGDTLTVSLKAGPSNGTLSLNTNGSFTYTPAEGFAGIDKFTYTVSDGNGGTDEADVIIIVNAVNVRHISVELQITQLTYGSSLTGSFTIKNTSGEGQAVKVDKFSLLSIQYKGPSDSDWVTVTVPSEVTFTHPSVDSIANGDTVNVLFECSPAGLPAVAAFKVTPGAQIEGL
jgi:hypothetical protein